MQYSTKRRVALGMTTGGVLMAGLGMATAHADTTATGSTSHSPGVGSGNLIQLPVTAPINVCGNQVDVIGILDSVTGNSCANNADSGHGGASATGSAKHSPGIASGNVVQVPINTPINLCGNQVDVVGVKNSVHGNSCANEGGNSTTATGHSTGSPGVGSGNVIQVPINAPINVCGNQVDVIGILDSVTGNSCANGAPGTQPTPPSSPTPPCGCTPPPPPPPTTPCPPSGSATSTTTPPAGGTPSASHTPGSTSTPSQGTASASTSSTGGTHHGGPNGNGGPGNSGVLAHTGAGTAALAAAPLGAGLIGGGLLLRKKFPSRRTH